MTDSEKLKAAQQALAGLWPLLLTVKDFLNPEQKKALEDAMKEIAPTYEVAMGDAE
jgi:hypothetical protein